MSNLETSKLPTKVSTFEKVDKMLDDCGKYASIMQIVFSVICIICFCGFGIILFKKKDNTIKTKATVLHGECNTYPVRNKNSTRMQTNCMLDIEYKVGQETLQSKITTSDRIHSKGEIIDISYDLVNPSNVTYNHISYKNIGKISIGIGSCIVFGLIIHIILMKTSEWYRKIACLNLLGNTIRGPGSGYDSGLDNRVFNNDGFGLNNVINTTF